MASVEFEVSYLTESTYFALDVAARQPPLFLAQHATASHWPPPSVPAELHSKCDTYSHKYYLHTSTTLSLAKLLILVHYLS